jgi:hypothetical protein
VAFEPLVAIAPVQAPEAVQAVAFAADQITVALLPLVTLVGLALNETLGAAVVEFPLMVTMAEAVVPKDAPSALAMATASFLVPLNGTALLIGITKDLGAASPLPQLSPPRSDV